jgi:flavodoxin
MKSRIHVDMDGLLADLFNTVSHKIYKRDYNTLTQDEKNKARIIWTDKSEFNNHFGDVDTFFANLEPFGSKTNEIIQLVVEFAKNNNDVFEEGYVICSHPASIDWQASKAGKIAWIQKHLNIQPVEMYFPDKKSIHATGQDGVPNVLIDDFPPYIQAWENAGGISVEMRTDAVNNVRQFLIPKLEQAKVKINEFINKRSIKTESFDNCVNSILTSFSA